MEHTPQKLKIVYVTPALYMAGGVERVLTLKANYFADHLGYDVTIVLTEGLGKPLFYPLSDKVKVVHLDINFEALWTCSFIKKVFVYVGKQYRFRKQLKAELMRLRPDITVSMLRREINFITSIKDGSRKVGELHVPRTFYRNLGNSILMKPLSKLWMSRLIGKLRQLDAFVVLTEKAKLTWPELTNVVVIPNPLSFPLPPENIAHEKRVIAVGRYSDEKGYDLLLQAWTMIQGACPEWRLEVFGDGDRAPYEALIDQLHIDRRRCLLHERTTHIQEEYAKSSLLCVSSRFEGFGMMILEAMSCGLPVVSFDCPWGPRAVITHGDDGLLVENGNVIQLATALRELMTNDARRQAMAKEAKGNAPWFQIDYIASMWQSLFEGVMASKRL